MVQDYAKSAKRHREKMKKKPQRSISMGKMLFVLLVVVAFGSFLAYLTQLQSNPVPSQAEIREEPVTPVTTTSNSDWTAPEDTNEEEDFAFYSLLPESEVIAPEVEEYNFKEKNAASDDTSYLLQAGSFRNQTDADRLRAKLLLEGLNVTVTPARNSNGSIWYRVMVGPFTDRSSLNRAQDTLVRANTEFLTLEYKND